MDEHANLSHLEITFAVGSDLLVIAPMHFDLAQMPREMGIIYTHVAFESRGFKGCVDCVTSPLSYHGLWQALTALSKGQHDSFTFSGTWFALEGCWDASRNAAAFKAWMPDLPTSGLPCGSHAAYVYRGEGMKTCVELAFWMKPVDIEEPLAEVVAILAHMKAVNPDYLDEYSK